MTKKKCDISLLEDLHDAVTAELLERVNGIEDENGDIIRPSIQDLNAAIKLLQNNEIMAKATPQSPLRALNNKVIELKDFSKEDDEESYLPKGMK